MTVIPAPISPASTAATPRSGDQPVPLGALARELAEAEGWDAVTTRRLAE